MEKEYLITTWKLDSNGFPLTNISSYKTYDSAFEMYTTERNKIFHALAGMEYTFLKFDSKKKKNEYFDYNLKNGDLYVIEEDWNDGVLSFYQDYGWKRPIGISLTTVHKNNDDNDMNALNWSTNVECYPLNHQY